MYTTIIFDEDTQEYAYVIKKENEDDIVEGGFSSYEEAEKALQEDEKETVRDVMLKRMNDLLIKLLEDYKDKYLNEYIPFSHKKWVNEMTDVAFSTAGIPEREQDEPWD